MFNLSLYLYISIFLISIYLPEIWDELGESPVALYDGEEDAQFALQSLAADVGDGNVRHRVVAQPSRVKFQSFYNHMRHRVVAQLSRVKVQLFYNHVRHWVVAQPSRVQF